MLDEVWLVPILRTWSISSLINKPQAKGPRLPVSPFRWAATGQKSVQFSQSAIPAGALAPPLHEPLQAQEHGGPFSRDCESAFEPEHEPEHVPLSLAHSPLQSRHRLDSLLTETVHFARPGVLTGPDKYKVIITGLHLLGEPYLLPSTLPFPMRSACIYFYLAPNGPFPSIHRRSLTLCSCSHRA